MASNAKCLYVCSPSQSIRCVCKGLYCIMLVFHKVGWFVLLLPRRLDLCMPLQEAVQLSVLCTAVRSAQLCCCTCVSHGCVIVRLQPSCSSDVLKSVFVLQVFEKLGLSLYDFLRVNQYRPFRIDVVRDFGRQLLESVAYLHGLDLIHTDLKPENILLAACDDDSKSPTPGIRSATLAPFLCFF